MRYRRTGSEESMTSLPGGFGAGGFGAGGFGAGEFGAGQPNGLETPPSSGGLSEPTGRYIVVLADSVHGDEGAMTSALRSIAGVSNITSASDFADGAVNMEQANGADALLLPRLGVAIVPAESDQLASLTTAAGEDDRIEAIEPEQTLYALT